MTTLAEIRETVTYEPTVNDKIQRIIYRLEHGEQLISGCLRKEDNFCILGLFADESGLGDWGAISNDWGESSYYVGDSGNGGKASVSLCDSLVEYYNLRSPCAAFNIDLLPEDLRIKLTAYNVLPNPYSTKLLPLDLINDHILTDRTEDYNYELNEILATIIRSGIIFRDHNEDQT